jgi:hypothetical protein
MMPEIPLTISTLRKEAKAIGWKLSVKSYSYGKHAVFTHTETGTLSCASVIAGMSESLKQGFMDLEKLKSKYHGQALDGEKLYGLN